MDRRTFTFGTLLLLASTVPAASAAESPRPFERVGRPASSFTAAHAARAIRPARATGVSRVVVDDDWSALSSGAPVSVGAGSYTIGTDAFATIQAGIDAVDPGGTVDVLPGNYTETAAGRTPLGVPGVYQFGLFLPASKPGLTVEGVDAGGVPIASYAAVQAHVTTNATDDFGPDGVWIEADNSTLAGLDVGTNLGGANKTITSTADHFTVRSCTITDPGGALYLDDTRYDAVGNVSHMQTYRIEGNRFALGNLISIQDGAGFTGPASGRVITANRFELGATDYWPSISFNGTGTGVPWFAYGVGGAAITGNTFVNADPQGQCIRSRGTVDLSQFDWAGYFSSNTFDREVAVGPAPPGILTTYSYPSGYGTFNDCRRIGASVQGEVDHAAGGDVVQVGGGTYVEQVVVNGTNLTINGSGRASTTIQSPASLPQFFSTSVDNHPVVFLENAPNVQVRNLTVDGAGMGNGNYRFMGIAFWEAGGKVTNCDVVHVRETPFNGDQHGNAIYATNVSGGPYAIEVGGCNVSDFQKNGITMNGAGLTANVHDCTVTGQGNISITAQNGVQFGFGAGGSVSNLSVSGIFYTPNTDAGCALLNYDATTVDVSGLTATDCQVGAYYQGTSGSAGGVSWGGNNSGVPGTGLFAYDDQASVANRAGAVVSGRAPLPASPVTESAVAGLARRASVTSAPMVVSFGPGCLSGDGLAGSVGAQAYGGGGPLQVGMSGLEISNFDHGIEIDGVDVTTTANHNSITANLSAGYFSQPGLVNDATLNWWGYPTGPGAGSAVSGPVTYAPWLIGGADSNPGCGFAPALDNAVVPGPAPSCVSITNGCVTIPVGIVRTTSDAVRGYSVTLQLSSNLALCSGTSSITQGAYLSSVNATDFEVVDNGGGSYTVDCAILGATAGATAGTGTLFSLGVKKNGPDGPGSVTITGVTMRSVTNGPVVASAGAPLAITVDTAVPSTITNLAAIQKKSGNDGSGRTKIQITFTAPGDAATVEVYRAPFGSYPEYDDAGGAVPAAPAYPPGSPWTLTGVTASGQYDQPATRDFWYYVVFTKDACGNVSAVSNRTGGTLDYFLGDVSDGVTPGVGNNHVSTEDISLLGAHYGASLAPNDPVNYLDVGPTTDYAVDSRPTTDNRVNFEDLIVFAINYGIVSAPQAAGGPIAHSGVNTLSAGPPAAHPEGGLFTVPVTMEAAGDVQGASVTLAYDTRAAEFVSAEPGELLQRQDRTAAVLSPSPGVVDFALLGMGPGVGGSGTLFNVRFRSIGSADPAVTVASIVARDAANRPVEMAGSRTPVPTTTSLGAAFPNPFGSGTHLHLALAREGVVRVAVFDLGGRHVRTLIDGVQSPGERTLTWDGRDDAGHLMPAGLYLARLEAPGTTESRRLIRMP